MSRRALLASAASVSVLRHARADTATGFAPSEIRHRYGHDLAVAKSLRAANVSSPTTATFGLNHVVAYGQSEAASVQGSPALTTTQPLDNLMLGQSTHPLGSVIGLDTTHNGRFIPLGDGNLHPLISVNQSFTTGQPVAVRHGLTNGLTVSTDGVHTFSFSGFDPRTFCLPGDAIALRGFTGAAAALNVDAGMGANHWYFVTAVTSNSVTVTEKLTLLGAPGQSGISLFLLFNQQLGEDWLVEALNFWRRTQLGAKSLASDPAHLLVGTNNAIGGKTVFDLSKPARTFSPATLQGVTVSAAARVFGATGTDLTRVLNVGDTFEVTGFVAPFGVFNRKTFTATAVTPTQVTVDQLPPIDVGTPQNGIIFSQPIPYFNSIPSAIGQIQAIAAAQGTSAGLVATVWLQGNADAYAGTSKSLYKSALQQLQLDIAAAAMAAPPVGYGQTTPPWFLTFQSSGDDADQRSGSGLPISMAQLELATPVFTSTGPAAPNWVMVGPAYAISRAGLHYDDNGNRWWGAMVGKVLHQVVDLGQAWYPLYPLQATWRAKQILVDFYVPTPPLRFKASLHDLALVQWADGGFTVYDDAGHIAVTAVTVASSTSVLISLRRAPTTNLVLEYGDTTYHYGTGNLCDSDTTVADVSYIYTGDGNGMPPTANNALVGQAYSLANWCVLFSIPVTPG